MSGLQVTLNHETQLFRVTLSGRVLGRFESVGTESGRNGRWWVFEGPRTVYVLAREED